jgi:predicted N-acyltransferase
MTHMALQIRFVTELAAVDPAAWDALRGEDDPFTSHAFLNGLEQAGCLDARYGWTPNHLLIESTTGELVAAAPAYLKTNSHGEFVFDHAWADAYHRAGMDYFPKLLVAVPYSPVSGPRLLVAGRKELRAVLLKALQDFCRRYSLSSAHINFHRADEVESPGWLARSDLQFHWNNAGHANFDAFLTTLQAKKRKNIRQERAQVAAAGVSLRIVHGDEASQAEIDTAHQLYARTFDQKGNHPALNLRFFNHLAAQLGRGLVLVLAERAGDTVAAAVCLRSSSTLYGRYWGCFEDIPGLHFECCYYQGIEYCLREGLQRFEPGAQGEHKLARGFLPAFTHSSHHLPLPAFHDAVAEALTHERQWLVEYRAELLSHSPYRKDEVAA